MQPHWPKIAGKVLVSATVQLSLGSLELPSRFMIRSLIRTQEAVDATISEMYSYIVIGLLWAIGTTILMYVQHYYAGAVANILVNLLCIWWIVYRRYTVLVETAAKYGLQVKSLL